MVDQARRPVWSFRRAACRRGSQRPRPIVARDARRRRRRRCCKWTAAPESTASRRWALHRDEAAPRAPWRQPRRRQTASAPPSCSRPRRIERIRPLRKCGLLIGEQPSYAVADRRRRRGAGTPTLGNARARRPPRRRGGARRISRRWHATLAALEPEAHMRSAVASPRAPASSRGLSMLAAAERRPAPAESGLWRRRPSPRGGPMRTAVERASAAAAAAAAILVSSDNSTRTARRGGAASAGETRTSAVNIGGASVARSAATSGCAAGRRRRRGGAVVGGVEVERRRRAQRVERERVHLRGRVAVDQHRQPVHGTGRRRRRRGT